MKESLSATDRTAGVCLTEIDWESSPSGSALQYLGSVSKSFHCYLPVSVHL